ncbi:MAG: bifunctional isocitrate dehydrogenase kinase/phosphatase [Chloroflexi bacterium]|nr:MAG: bifunctional isocitrate dehydrogenase kinase/phosphatase [Chloroflexota bacterium]
MSLPAARRPSEDAGPAAAAILDGFERYRKRFAEVTRRAGGRFDRRDWKGTLNDATDRLDLYGEVVHEVENEVRRLLWTHLRETEIWAAVKGSYSSLIAGRPDWEIAETFLNSVTRRIFATAGVEPDIEFIDSDFDPPTPEPPESLCRQYAGQDLEAVIGAILGDNWFAAAWEDRARDVRLATASLRRQLAELGAAEGTLRGAEMMAAPFFRRKGAYLVGRLIAEAGHRPLVLAVLNTERGLRIDAVLTDVDHVSVLFSFTRSHFHVDLDPPYQVVRYLKRLLPRKPVAELYIALGYHKHGKTELYRDLLRHLRESDSRFEVAPGVPGMVMVVFTMTGYDVVFKLIRDHIPAIKPVTPLAVRNNYQLVFRHDRAGRLVEAQEFEHLKFERARFGEDLIMEFAHDADKTVSVGDAEIVVHHAYVERRVAPLDVYLGFAEPEAARAAVVDFGQAVKDLAANGIFPGELLPKNFGVTRNGRVVCYDYDELGLLTDFTFRDMPAAQHDDDDFDSEAWFGVGPRDVFPEEFPRFMGLPPEHQKVMDEVHGDLYTVDFWHQMQSQIQQGEIIDIFPYPQATRLLDHVPVQEEPNEKSLQS